MLKPDLTNIRGSSKHVLVEMVEPGSSADREGLYLTKEQHNHCVLGMTVGDEIVLINDNAVSQMTWDDVISVLKGKRHRRVQL